MSFEMLFEMACHLGVGMYDLKCMQVRKGTNTTDKRGENRAS